MSSPFPAYLTSAEVAAVLRIRPIEVGVLIKGGKLAAIKPGGRYLIHPDDLWAYLGAGSSRDVA